MGVTETTVFDLVQNQVALQSMTKAIIRHELGCQPYSDELIDTGITWERDGIPSRITQE